MYLFRENGESILVDTGTGVFDPVKFLLEYGFINKKPKVNKYVKVKMIVLKVDSQSNHIK